MLGGAAACAEEPAGGWVSASPARSPRNTIVGSVGGSLKPAHQGSLLNAYRVGLLMAHRGETSSLIESGIWSNRNVICSKTVGLYSTLR